MPTHRLPCAATLLVSLWTSAAGGALHDRGGGMIYDDALDITWLKDANYASTSGYVTPGGRDVQAGSGGMDWYEATTWASTLNVFGVTGWRLPKLIDTGLPGCDFGYSGTDCGYNVDPATSELAHMFHVTLGNLSQFDSSGNQRPGVQGMTWGLVNSGPFENLLANDYWTGTEYQPDTSYAWHFYPNRGEQDWGHFKINNRMLAWAVRDGDVTPVPEPAAYAFMLAGLVAVGAAACRARRARVALQ